MEPNHVPPFQPWVDVVEAPDGVLTLVIHSGWSPQDETMYTLLRAPRRPPKRVYSTRR
jgi:hypothetical protein